MESLTFLEETKPMFSAGNDISTANLEGNPGGHVMPGGHTESAFSPLAPAFNGHSPNELMNMLSAQEPKAGDTAPSSSELDDMMMNFRMNGSEMAFGDMDGSQNNYYMGSRPESVTSSRNNIWNNNASNRQNEQNTTFDFLVKSVSAASNYVSMLTREQLTVLQCLRPSLLYEFLQEVAKVRSDRRMRRALPNECAFCKNNGENEECYSSHALKDWRGRVLCPVLRAFRCPRCGATGDRAHTIKYCPENNDTDRSVLTGRRRMPPSASLLLGGQGSSTTPPGSAPPPSPTPAPMAHSALWSSFGIN